MVSLGLYITFQFEMLTPDGDVSHRNQETKEKCSSSEINL